MIPRLLVHETLDLTAPEAVVGTHAVWLPQRGLKIPFQFGGFVQKYRRSGETSYPLESLAEEHAFLRWLAERRMAPPVDRWVYFKLVISEHLGAWWADPCGAYGWEMADARHLPAGQFSAEALKASELVEGSPGAWNDLNKPGNVINGYLVDARRSWHDRLRWLGPIAPMPRYEEHVQTLLWDLQETGAFPLRERVEPYQEVWLDGRWHPAEREVVNRAALLRFAPAPGESVVDLGCHTGGFLQHAWLRQAATGPIGRLIGLDSQPEYLALARRLTRAAGMNVCYRQATLGDDRWVPAWVGDLLAGSPDHVLALSLAKHLPGGEAMLWAHVDAFGARRTYLESHAVKDGAWPLREGATARGGVFLGTTNDRNQRHLYLIPSTGKRGIL